MTSKNRVQQHLGTIDNSLEDHINPLPNGKTEGQYGHVQENIFLFWPNLIGEKLKASRSSG